jgi:hypothetical protein
MVLEEQSKHREELIVVVEHRTEKGQNNHLEEKQTELQLMERRSVWGFVDDHRGGLMKLEKETNLP